MSKIDGYSVYQNQYYGNSVKDKKDAAKSESGKSAKADKTSKTDSVQLSDKAKALLKELQKRYGDMDFFVANYSSDAEAQSYLSRGTKEYSLLIDPETLEAMAADEDTKNEYLNQIDSARSSINGMMAQIDQTGEEVTRVGISIDKEGKVSYFAELEQISDRYGEYIEKTREKNREEKAEKAKAAEKEAKENAGSAKDAAKLAAFSPDKVKRTTVTADSVEELLEKIKNVDWNQVGAEDARKSGGRFDLSI